MQQAMKTETKTCNKRKVETKIDIRESKLGEIHENIRLKEKDGIIPSFSFSLMFSCILHGFIFSSTYCCLYIQLFKTIGKPFHYLNLVFDLSYCPVFVKKL